MIPTFSTTNFQLFLDFVKKDAISHTVVIQISLKNITYVCFKLVLLYKDKHVWWHAVQ